MSASIVVRSLIEVTRCILLGRTKYFKFEIYYVVYFYFFLINIFLNI
jgi:hypothetical protein